MPLEKIVKQFFFSQGPDSKVTHEGIEAGKLTILEAGKFDKVGAISHQDGSQAYGANATSPVVTLPTTIGVVENVDGINALPIVMSKNPYSLPTGSNLSTPNWIFQWDRSISKWRGYLSGGNALTEEFNYGKVGDYLSSYNSLSECVYYNGLIYLAASSLDFQKLIVIDPKTEVAIELLESRSNNTGTGFCKVILFNSKIYFFYWSNGTNILNATEYDPVTGFLSTQNVVGDLYAVVPTGTTYDIWVDNTNLKVYLAYKNSGASTLTINSYSVLTSGAPATPLTPVNTVTIATVVGGCISIIGTLDVGLPIIITTFEDAGGLNAISYQHTLALAASFGPSTILTAAVGQTIRSITASPNTYDGRNTVYVTYTILNGSLSYPAIAAVPIIGGAIGTTKTTLGVEVYSKPIKVGSTDYIWLKGNRTGQGAMYLAATRGGNVSGDAFYLVGKVYSGQFVANGAPVYGLVGSPMSIAGPDSDGNYFVGSAKIITELSPTDFTVLGSIVSFNPTAKERWKSQFIADSLIFNGGILGQFDGEGYYENGFLEYPDSGNFIATPANSTGSLTPSTTYSIALVWEAVDANGKVTLSAPSVPIAVVMGAADDTINYSFFNNIYSISEKPNYNLLIYRTTGSGSVYYFDKRIPGMAGLSTTSGSLLQSDATIQSNALLYTQSGELENWSPWGVYDVAVFKDRAFVLTADGLYFSKKVELGDPIEFSEALQIPVESAGGKATAIIAFQDKLLLFKRDRIYYLVGDGPNDTGTYGDFSPLQLLNVSAGCINNRSTLVHESYVYFQSVNAICRLNAKLELERIGEPLNYYFLQQPSILSCTLNSKDDQIRWTDANRTYVYCYDVGQWSIYPTRPAVSSTMIEDQYLFVAGNQLNKEVSSAITEYTGSTPTMRVATGWIQFGNIQGFQRVYSAIILGRKRANHTLTVRVMYDYVPVIVEDHVIDETSANSYIYTDQILYEGGTAATTTGLDQVNKPYQYKIRLKRQQCQSVRFLIEESNQNSAGTVDLVGIAFELGIKAQTNKQWMGDTRNV